MGKRYRVPGPPLGGGQGYSIHPWVGRCSLATQTLTKNCQISYPQPKPNERPKWWCPTLERSWTFLQNAQKCFFLSLIAVCYSIQPHATFLSNQVLNRELGTSSFNSNTFLPGPPTTKPHEPRCTKILKNRPGALRVGRPWENIFHHCGEEDGAKSPSKGIKTQTLLELTELSNRLLLKGHYHGWS